MIDSVDLVIHEAGHSIIFFLGQFVQVISGSFFQILIPFLFMGYFYNRSDYFSVSLILSWLSYNLVNVSVYISDGVHMQLPLLGGESVIHDWNYILSHTGLLSYASEIGYVVHSAGIILMTVSVVFSFWFAFYQKTSRN